MLLIALVVGVLEWFAVATADSHSPDSLPGGAFVARVYYDDLSDINRLTAYDVWEYNNLKEQYVLVALNATAYERLQEQGWRLAVDEETTAVMNGRNQINTFASGYRTVDELYAELEAINDASPALTELVDYGDSYCKTKGGCTTLGGEPQPGYDLLAVRVSNEAITGTSTISGTTVISRAVTSDAVTPGTKPVLFLMANLHARELTTPELAMRMLDWLVEGYGTSADATWLVDWHEIWIVPTANPDGHWLVELGTAPPYAGTPFLQRKNADRDANDDGFDDCTVWPPGGGDSYGVDLNRNHSFEWGGLGTSTAPCSQLYRGPTAASEPEVAHLQILIQALIPDQRGSQPTDAAPPGTAGLFISLHNFGRLILWPWGYTDLPAPNKAGLQAIGDKLAAYNGYQSCQPGNCLYYASGISDDWVYGELGIPAFTFEIGDWFTPPYSEIGAIQWPKNRPAFQYAAKIARTPYLTVQGPEVTGISTAVSGPNTVTITATIDDSQNGGQAVATAAYYLDVPHWVANTVTHTLTTRDGAFDSPVETVTAVIDTGSLEPDRSHILFVRGQDAAGSWGAVSAVFIRRVENHYLPLVGRSVSK